MPVAYTVGHSNRSLEEFIKLLLKVDASLVVDVRRWPTSRRLPHFASERLGEALRAHGIEYTWAPELGGYRRFGVDVPRELEERAPHCLKSPGFRAYFVYLRVNESARRRLEWLARVAGERVVVIMCRERLPWRCHRKLVADVLVLKGVDVVHIIDEGRLVSHVVPECRRGWESWGE
ncbi:DUF488 domain-containing protein [Stetteria hydrogenophila]